ncbi:MAG TPA: hypothetical protein PKX58_07635 [Flexilinea sp.]|nr:hypothetical protein [Flexilinea sp.]HPJ65868.1 hypothetical protein [Flexilinea sp.]HPR71252.1 hypothetical protein [Flexilinea sp.]
MREDSAQDVGAADVFPLALGERVRVREDSERDIVNTDVFPLALWERVKVREGSEREVWTADVFPLALGERVRVREDSERDVVAADVFPLALWERVRVREGSERDVIPYGCPFGHGYKEGSVWNRPLRYFSQPWDVGIADVFPLALGERVRVRENSERDIVYTDVFPLALGERVRVRENSQRDAVPYGCPFGHGYKEGSVWNRPLRYFSQPRDVGDVDVFPLALWERVRVRE